MTRVTTCVMKIPVDRGRDRRQMSVMQSRERNMVLRVSDEELGMAHAIATAENETIATVVRRFLREAYRARFGDIVPPAPRLKHGRKRK